MNRCGVGDNLGAGPLPSGPDGQANISRTGHGHSSSFPLGGVSQANG